MNLRKIVSAAVVCSAALARAETTSTPSIPPLRQAMPAVSSASLSLLPLPALMDEDTTSTTKTPSLSDDTVTSLSGGAEFYRPVAYWGFVGNKNGYSLATLLETARRANPNWARFAANHATAHAALLEACALPNPEIEGEIGSERSREGGGSRGTWSLGFAQPIEMPGKRRARQAEALAGFPVVEQEAAEFANTLRADVREAYWTVQYHTALEQMHQAQVSLTKKQSDLAQRRLELGDAGRMEMLNARVELLKSQRDYEVARRRKLGAMAALNALCGGQLSSQFRLAQDFPHQYKRPALDPAIRQALSMHPRLSRLAAQLEEKYAGIERQRREWWPDVKVGARHSREFDTDSNAITAGIEIPLWNRNEGGIARARADAQKIYAEIGLAYNEMRRDVEVGYQNLMIAREQIDSFDNGIRSAAEEAVSLAWEQLNLGGGGYLDILLARRQLLEVQQGYIQALFDAATAQAKFDQAVGR